MQAMQVMQVMGVALHASAASAGVNLSSPIDMPLAPVVTRAPPDERT